MKVWVLIATMSVLGLLTGCGEPRNEAESPFAGNVQHAGAYLPDASRKYPERVLWGDEHVHSSWSADAGLAGATLTPEDAVRFARGETVKSSTGLDAKLERPLDWIAVTEHSDGMGTINELQAGNREMLADATARRWYEMMRGTREENLAAKKEAVSAQANKKLPGIMMDPKWLVSAWQKNVDVMEKYNQPGIFTAFIAYEWTSNGERGENLHRNVIFRDGADKTRSTFPLTTFVSAVPGRAGTDPESLWKWLADWEAKSGGKVLAIPHNGNMSNGWMFREARYDGSPMTNQWAAARERWERLYELYQYKGTGEAHPGLAPSDEFAGFGIWDTADLDGHAKKPGDINAEYWRDALKNGMKLVSSLGGNPFKYGAAGGTDTHNGLSTGGEENNFYGKFATNEPSANRWNNAYKAEEAGMRKDWTLMAAGLTGVWAKSNTRADLWDAMFRRETYASSGPRITVRFFGGFGYHPGAAGRNLVATGYANGVPMGGDLKAAPVGKSPTFLFAAMKDPMGANLDRVQVVKGWVDAAGRTHEKIFDVKWSGNRKPGPGGKLPPMGNTVDLATAKYSNSIGAPELVGWFRDPQFNPKERAFYYLRVVEIPTPRWTLYDAVRFKVKMAPGVPMTQQERAVTSPIWYSPA
ncbi:MAG: DUF3604 domain-containing protein [Alphaproteobacteria bacterium]